MPVMEILLVLILCGVAVYVVNNVIPMDPKFKLLVNVVIAVAAVLWLFSMFGYGPGINLRGHR